MNLVKCRVKYNHKIYPRTPHSSGEFAIMRFEIVEILEGEDIGIIETFKGDMCEIEWGEIYTVIAERVEDPTYGKQYEIKYIGQPAKLDSKEEQKIFLSKILTENQIKNLYDSLEDPIKVIMSRDTEKLCDVEGIGVSTAIKMIDKVHHSIDYSEAYVALDHLGLTKNTIEKLVDTYGSPEIVINQINKNPYETLTKVDGIGFRKADDIALENGYTENDPRRLLYLSQYVLNEYANNGHSYVHAYDFMDRIEEETYELDRQAFGNIIKSNPNIFYVFDRDGERYIALQEIHQLEERVAEELIRIRDGANEFEYDKWMEKVRKIEEEQGWEHTDEQLEAIEKLIKNQVVVVTGYGGSGKTSSVKAVTEILSKYSFAQTALSGRASSRMAEITGEEGYTIHRLLGYNPRTGFYYNKENQLDVDIIILDELSMVGGEIFLKLIEAIKTGSKLVLLGDEGQLESIGKMNILTDLVESGAIVSCRLTQIHRQAKKSGIIEASMKFRKGEQLFNSNYEGQMILGELEDFELNVVKDRKLLPNMIAEQFKDWKDKVDINELQVIVPMKERGDISCLPLNIKLQNIYNPEKKGMKAKSIKKKKGNVEFEIRVGDKVINRKNNYYTVNLQGKTTPIFNGYIGIVTELDEKQGTAIIDFYGIGEIYVTKKAMKGIELGYAITTHSYQGSQADVIIYSIDHTAYMLLNREQIYTGVTRAQKYCIMNTENKSLRYAIDHSEVKNKRTFLKDILDKYKIKNIE